MHAPVSNRVLAVTLLIVVASAMRGAAEVKPHPLFSDGGILQRGVMVPVWGTAEPNEEVTVRFCGQEKATIAADGRWRVNLEPLEAGGPFEMTIVGNENQTKTIGNLMVGEVWIASGQSNMEWRLDKCDKAAEVIKNSANPQIRLLTVKRQFRAEPQDELEVSWAESSPQSVPDFSGVAYYFGRALHEKLQVPVGLINCNYGGSTAEAWMSRDALKADPAFKKLADNRRLRNHHSPTGLYNAMLHPLIPYAMRGVIWYQGESNVARSVEYRSLFPALIKQWRAEWELGDFPFLLVQLAPFEKIDFEPRASEWAELRDAQLSATQTLPAVGMAVITDVGDEYDVHPIWKEPVGNRLALAARAIAYDEKVPYRGPEFYEQRVDGDRIVLSFKHADGGLVARGGGPLFGFTIAGKDGKFVNAYGEIQGGNVVVHSPEVKEPVGVRYGWANYPVVNLWNGAGLPASPFRSDDFPLTTK